MSSQYVRFRTTNECTMLLLCGQDFGKHIVSIVVHMANFKHAMQAEYKIVPQFNLL
jgi:hypothetical protein